MKLIESLFSARNTTAVLILAAGFWSARQIRAFNPQPDPPAFGVMNILPSEAIRINARCFASVGSSLVSPGPCRFVLGFQDMNGNIVAQAARSLAAGRSSTLDVASTQIPFGRESYAGLVPFVSSDGPGAVIATVEIVDAATGRTEVFANAAVAQSSQLTVQ